MYKIDFEKPIHIHFIGIGGISMSGLAEILLEEGFTVSGSDAKESPLTKKLASEGARIAYGQCAENITDDIDCVVYTAAINRSNPELIEAVARKIPMLTRAELLGQLMKNYDMPIAVSGTHGKTTTTSMISHILLEGDLDPTISVGGILKAIGGNIRVGNSETFITEACEYTNSFLHFFPKIAVILNIEEDHLDFFKDIEDIRHSFHQFAALLPSDGTLVINGDIQDYTEIYAGLDCHVVTYGSSADFDYSADNISYDENGHVSFDLIKYGENAGHIQLSVTGDHNVSNALASIAVGELLNIPGETIRKGLLSFTGTDRRFEYKGEFNGVTVVDDYAHHPTEIAATLKAAKHYPHNAVWCVFQPHTYTRTKAFFHEFAEALSHTDHLVLADIYAARETDTLGISSADLAEEARKLGTDTHYFPSFAEIEQFLRDNCRPGDLLITMGAGDVVNVGEDLLK
ncbi:UDP-N-acetylmuramate--L-alanine ligase [Lachnoclostridium sp. An169]|uniref:UDP-N-acetylmuramate--L-alanine ligase n=1 Tax=Lachnoclostridium sp. An169 TaxID=1965569 RepID=UPI000B38DF3A|nr:UDP-N-acetylmuramate--L-alanine ligase [Lachnoclostridium sp. An169]OUP83255.1 UDP-N-acetylmuramate--L-alanine ligase [Lachnoclostridium sp. An169]HJA66323.1 UDP-N-acetylmuramate--L-alanine ligase [Candidatus Mediterraneibacter cottocaccae]